MTPPAPITLRPAGPPQLLAAGGALRAGSRRALAMAVILALETEVSRDRLADLLWPGTERAAARRNLRRDLFRLREQGLQIVDAGVDVIALRELAVDWPEPDGRAPDWLAGLEDAGGAELADWLAGQRVALQQRWIEALGARAAWLEQQGDDTGALRLWQALLHDTAAGADHAPARRAALRLHQQGGDHAAALALGRGNAPPPAAPSLAAAPPALAGALPFTGRADLLAAVAAALQRRQVVFIDGAPGAGKTRLALEATAALGGTLHLRCRPEDAADAFASAQRLLDELRDAAPDVELPAWVRQELAPLVPAWQRADAPAAAPAQGLQRMKGAFEAAWRALARDNFGAVVLDDWQWADASSLALWSLDATPDEASPLARVVVHRAGELPPTALDRKRALVDAGHAVAVHVGDFDLADVRALVQRLSGQPGGERFAARLHRATAGNPLFVQETLRHLFATGLLEGDARSGWRTPFDAVTDDYAELAVPPSVRDTVLARARALGPTVRRVLEAASLAGDALTPRLLALPAGVDELAAADALDHAAAADLLVAQRGGYRFAHDLVAQALADSLTPARRATLHDRLAERLVAAGGPPGRIAAHLEAAGRAPDAGPWHQAAAQAAQRRHAPQEALRHAGRALAAVEDPARRTELQLQRVTLFRLLGDPQSLATALDAALGDAARVGRTRTLDVLIERATERVLQDRSEEAEAALAAIAEDPALTLAQRSRVETERARALSARGRHGEATVLLRAQLARVDASALRERVLLLGVLSRTCFWAGDATAGVAAALELVDLARVLGDDNRAAAGLGHLGAAARNRGEFALAEQLLGECRALSARAGDLHQQRVALYNLVALFTDQGRAAEAEALLDEAEALSPYWENPLFRQVFIEARYYLHYLRGDAAAAGDAALQVLAAARTLGNPRGLVGAIRLVFDLYLHTGQSAQARALVDEAEAVLAKTDPSGGDHDEIAVRALQLAQAGGDHAAATVGLRALRPALARLRSDEQARAIAVAAQVALDDGEFALAQALLAGADPARCTIEVRALLLAARLRLARTAAVGEADAQAAAAALLADPHLPRFEAALLARAAA